MAAKPLPGSVTGEQLLWQIEYARSIRLLHPRNNDGELIDIRIKYPQSAPQRVADRVFRGIQDAAAYVQEQCAQYDVEAVWQGLNHIRQDSDIVSRGVADADIDYYTNLLIDLDPDRPADTNSTDAELAAAAESARRIKDGLGALGWPEPIEAMSGNGHQLAFRIDPPIANTSENKEMVKAVLNRLADIYDTEAVHVDRKVYNPSRVVKLWGTMTRKGPDSAERPQRRSSILSVASLDSVVTAEQLRDFIGGYTPQAAGQRAAVAKPSVLVPGGKIQQGNRNDTMFRLACVLRNQGLAGQAIWDAVKAQNKAVCEPPLSQDELRETVKNVIQRYPAGDPAAWKGLDDQRLPVDETEPEFVAAAAETAEMPAQLIETLLPLHDTGNALRFAQQWGSEYRYCPERGWMRWDGSRWIEDKDGAIVRAATETADEINDELLAATPFAIKSAATAASIAPEKLAAKWAKWAHDSHSRGRLDAMIELARSRQGITVPIERFDADHWLLNCQNGTLNLRTLEFKEARRDDLITRQAPVSYDPQSKCPRWQRFLKEISDGRDEMPGYLQRLAGHCLTGDTSEQSFWILWGDGENGKGVYRDTIQSLLGSDRDGYAVEAQPKFFIRRDAPGIPSELASWKGARLVTAAEPPSGAPADESLIKSLTGQDMVRCRFLFKEYFSYRPTFKILVLANRPLSIHDSDHGVWRRLRLLPFTATFTGEARDKELRQKLQDELPGILNWAIEGLRQWQGAGLGMPAFLREATEGYRAEEDRIAAFLAQQTEPNGETQANALYTTYSFWAEERGEKPLSMRRWSQALRSHGVLTRTLHGRTLLNVRLRTQGAALSVDEITS